MSETFKPRPVRGRNYPPVKFRLMGGGKSNRLSVHEKQELDADFNLDLRNCYAVVAVTRSEFDSLQLRKRKTPREINAEKILSNLDDISSEIASLPGSPDDWQICDRLIDCIRDLITLPPRLDLEKEGTP
jgi:hypothetical protein